MVGGGRQPGVHSASPPTVLKPHAAGEDQQGKDDGGDPADGLSPKYTGDIYGDIEDGDRGQDDGSQNHDDEAVQVHTTWNTYFSDPADNL